MVYQLVIGYYRGLYRQVTGSGMTRRENYGRKSRQNRDGVEIFFHNLPRLLPLLLAVKVRVLRMTDRIYYIKNSFFISVIIFCLAIATQNETADGYFCHCFSDVGPRGLTNCKFALITGTFLKSMFLEKGN